MGRRFLWSWAGVSVLLMLRVSAYLTVSEDSACARSTSSLAWLYLEPANGGAALLNFDSRPRHSGCSLVVLPTADYLLKSSSDYLLSVRLVPRDVARPDARRHGACSLKVMPPHSLRPTWELDLCNHTSLSRVLLMRDNYFPHAALLSWEVSRDARDYLQASGILLSLVTKGSEECSNPEMVPCLKRGASTLLCVSSKLACDGQVNCPVGGFDEDQELCRQKNAPSTPQLAVRDAQRVTSPPVRDYEDQEGRLTNPSDSLAKALAHYGPWGYLMLGTLLCGALLMVCGLWECCCRGRAGKRTATRLPPQPPAAAVYIISTPETPATAPAPPSYEELDQPPDYGALFPADKERPAKTPASSC